VCGGGGGERGCSDCAHYAAFTLKLLLSQHGLSLYPQIRFLFSFDTQEPGSSACSDCAPGLYSAAAAANCLSCPSGTFSTAYGSLNDAMRGITDLNQDANIDLDEFAQVSFTLNEFNFDN